MASFEVNVLPQCFTGETEENHKKPVSIACIQADLLSTECEFLLVHRDFPLSDVISREDSDSFRRSGGPAIPLDAVAAREWDGPNGCEPMISECDRLKIDV